MLNYIKLFKPGIVRGNTITAAGGFLFASGGIIDFSLLVALLAGAALIMAGACVLNNYIDRGIDSKMKRTEQRALVTNAVSGKVAILYGLTLSVTGFGILATFTNNLALAVGIVGFVDYVIIYGYAKRRTHHSTLIGTIAGATPPVAGYVAVSGRIDLAACLLFIVLVFWQMPHFYAIAINRQKDYKKAGLPMLPIVKGIARTKIEMSIYGVLFVLATTSLYVYGLAGFIYLFLMLILSLYWLKLITDGFLVKDNIAWANKIFGFSLFVLLSFSILISFDSYLF